MSKPQKGDATWREWLRLQKKENSTPMDEYHQPKAGWWYVPARSAWDQTPIFVPYKK